VLLRSHKDTARKAFERVTKSVLPASHRALQRALEAEAKDDRRFPVVDEPAVTATVVGDRCLGIEDPVLVTRLGDLARLAGAELLTVGLSHAGKDACFVAASPWPDLTDDAVLDAVLELAGVSARGMLAGA